MEVNEYLNSLPPEKSRAIVARLNSLDAGPRMEMLARLKAAAAAAGYTESPSPMQSPMQQNIMPARSQDPFGGGNFARSNPLHNAAKQVRRNKNRSQTQNVPGFTLASPEPVESRTSKIVEPAKVPEAAPASKPNPFAELMRGSDELKKAFIMSEIFRVPLCKRRRKI